MLLHKNAKNNKLTKLLLKKIASTTPLVKINFSCSNAISLGGEIGI